MEPTIQYARAQDGVALATFTLGEGPPIVFMPYLPVSNLEMEWSIPLLRDWVGWFGGHRTLIRYDSRGAGLSSRAVADLSIEAHVADLVAVLDAHGAPQTDIVSGSFAGPIALAFAARHPARVRKLVLWCTHAAFADVEVRLGSAAREQRLALEQLAEVDQELYLRTWLHRAVGWVEGGPASALFQLVRGSFDAETLPRALRAFRAFDVSQELDQITAPTLVMHRRDFPGSHVDVARDLAARIPGARLALFEGESVIPFIGDAVRVVAVIEEFLGPEGVTRTPRPIPAEGEGAVRTILFTDIEGHTAMTQRLGDAAARDYLRLHERVTREAIRTFAGEEVKTMGDGFMVSFGSAQRALECAIAMQREFGRLATLGQFPARVRMGLNAGEPIAEGGDLFGSAVITASRIAELAAGGEVLVANVVRELVAGHAFTFEDRGDTALRGFEGRARVYALAWG